MIKHRHEWITTVIWLNWSKRCTTVLVILFFTNSLNILNSLTVIMGPFFTTDKSNRKAICLLWPCKNYLMVDIKMRHWTWPWCQFSFGLKQNFNVIHLFKQFLACFDNFVYVSHCYHLLKTFTSIYCNHDSLNAAVITGRCVEAIVGRMAKYIYGIGLSTARVFRQRISIMEDEKKSFFSLIKKNKRSRMVK